jgi:hypothetical protein
VRPSTRFFVWAFLAVFAVCGLAGIEAWPFSGFRLFSHVRTDQVAGWEVMAVDRDGGERPVVVGDRSWLHVAAGMEDLPDDERLAVCRAWVPGAHVEVRVYRTWRPIDGGGSEPRRELRATCRL